MGDSGAEPSMEDILSSIKRIIAEEGDGLQRTRRPSIRPVPTAERRPAEQRGGDPAEVLELRDPMPRDPAPATAVRFSPEAVDPRDLGAKVARAAPAVSAAPVAPAMSVVSDIVSHETAQAARGGLAAAPSAVDDIVSQETAQAARGALDALSRLLLKPEPESDGTLEGLVREMLRPMLREWLEAHLPTIVEAIVAREIARITGAAAADSPRP